MIEIIEDILQYVSPHGLGLSLREGKNNFHTSRGKVQLNIYGTSR